MRLDAWIRKEGYGALSRLSRATGLSYGTIFAAHARTARTSYQSAARIERATKGQVTIAEICGAKLVTNRRKRAA